MSNRIIGYSTLFLWPYHRPTNLLNKVNTLLQVHAEIDELPLDSLFLVLLLLQDEHVMIEELLETFVGVVDTQLFERVVLQHHNISFYLSAYVAILVNTPSMLS